MIKSMPAVPQADRLATERHIIMENIWKGMNILVMLGLPASLSRTLVTGWLNIYYLHIGLAALTVCVYFLRNRIAYGVKLAILMLIFWSMGIVGIFSLGIVGSGFWWMVVSSLLMTVLHSRRAGVITALSSLLVFCLAAVSYISGYVVVPFDLNVYAASPSAWITLMASTVIIPLIVFQAISTFQQRILELLYEVQRQHDEIRMLATHDQLTGLPSRNLSHDRLERAIIGAHRSHQKVALLFIDLDGFKFVNDTYGHPAGDSALKNVAKRLSHSIRKDDTAARIGGDEFIVILGNIPDGGVAAEIAGKIIDAISVPISHAGHSFLLGASIGIGIFPDHATGMEELWHVADEAMYTAKRFGKNRFVFAQRIASYASS